MTGDRAIQGNDAAVCKCRHASGSAGAGLAYQAFVSRNLSPRVLVPWVRGNSAIAVMVVNSKAETVMDHGSIKQFGVARP
jgi:hypothetical protein